MNRKSWWSPISAGTASLRSSTKPGAAAAANLDVTLAGGIALPSKRLGADQPLREQHGHGLAALERHGQRRARGRDHVLRLLDAHADDAHGLQHRLGRLAHGKLPWIALAEIAAHADQREERKAPALDQREHVDAVADAARLHQQHGPRAAEIGAGAPRLPLRWSMESNAP